MCYPYATIKDAQVQQALILLLDQSYPPTAVLCLYQNNMSRDIRFPTMWSVRPAKAQTSLRIRAV